MFQERVSLPSDTAQAGTPRSERRPFVPDGFVARGLYANLGKRSLDLGGALFLSLLFLPIMLLVAGLVRSQGKGVIFGHERIGRDGRPFRCLKFRSMVPDADHRLNELLENDPKARQYWLENHKLEDDPRITRLGSLLRRTSMDELPQLWNVIRGDMSLVGPRPVTQTELTERYGETALAYMSVRPGLTGPWQVGGRNDISYDERVRIDRTYAQAHSLRLDMAILCRTVMVVVGATGK